MPISKRLRYEILRRDNHTCRYCGRAAPDVALTVDHVTPTTLGGSDEPDNLVAACRDCNSGKSSMSPDAPLVADVQQSALRWTAAMKLAAENRATRRQAMNAYCLRFMREWDDYCSDSRFYDPVLPDGYDDSIESFYRAGLPIEELIRALAVSMSKSHIGRYDKFRYMAGICWSVLTEMQNDARRIVESEGTPDAS